MTDKDLKTTLKKESNDTLLKIQAFFGNCDAKETLRQRKENRIIATNFRYILDENKKYDYRGKNVIVSEEDLRKYARKLIEYYEKPIDKRDSREETRLSMNIRSLVAKRTFDEREDILLGDRAEFLAFSSQNDNYKKYRKLQEYASFNDYTSIAKLGKDYLSELDKTLEKCLNNQQLAEYRKQYNGKSFTELYQKYIDMGYDKKDKDIQNNERIIGAYR